MQSWEHVFRHGFAPHLPTEGLAALATALKTDDGRLLQGATCSPPPHSAVADWPCEGACAIGMCGWGLNYDTTVGEVGEFFAHACHAADTALGEPAAVRYFLSWFDDAPRDTIRRELLPVVESILEARRAG